MMEPSTKHSFPPHVRKLRHDLRGCANTIVLSATVLPLLDEEKEILESIDQILISADKLIVTLDQLEALPEHFAEPPPSAPAS